MNSPEGYIDFEGLILRVAVDAGLHRVPDATNNQARIPTDPHTLDRIKRAINDARAEIYRRASTMTVFRPFVSFQTTGDGSAANNVLGDPSKYLMPLTGRALAIGRWSWRSTDGGGFGGQLDQRHPQDIAQNHTAGGSSSMGPPRMFALSHHLLTDPANAAKRRIGTFLWLYPVPDAVYVIEGQLQLMYAPLVELGDIDPMGEEHAQTIVEGAAWAMRKGREDHAHRFAMFLNAIQVSKQADADRRPQSIGVMQDPDSVASTSIFSPYESDMSRMVSHVNGIPVL